MLYLHNTHLKCQFRFSAFHTVSLCVIWYVGFMMISSELRPIELRNEVHLIFYRLLLLRAAVSSNQGIEDPCHVTLTVSRDSHSVT